MVTRLKSPRSDGSDPAWTPARSPPHFLPRGGTCEYPSPRGNPRLPFGQGKTNGCGRLSRLPCPKKTEYPRDKLPPMMDNRNRKGYRLGRRPGQQGPHLPSGNQN